MLTQDRPLKVTVVATPQSDNLDVVFDGCIIGKVQAFLVCDLHADDQATAESLGLKGGDDCYLYDGQVYSNHGSATAQVVADHLAVTARW